ncbi:uncharacterized protein MELLADRAFT_60009 [Melampsora larici-populina 98AG31]|uniref:Zn(2)-C6 fungal-type domain-containing protein n=1 Tax=Melampsora larici-populina (strain 98AG31 / pathotype 3-4-7) TaxID=747676 RepID=F4R9M3_MELLP|nr:uncharacterized protein MELLADRAFT_60009 [Melampsora larici-populina 98AG31]EGG11004.1 hypothetical protein MELLADRAFT_60009 [Melampsora larici-populina 98AG31]
MSAIRRKDLTNGPSFTTIPYHHTPQQQSPGYETDEQPQPPSPGSQQPHYLHHQQPLPAFETLPPIKTEPKPMPEPAPKEASFGPVRAKKKPAGSACNSCHRLKTRCSGGYPCDRCAAHKVPCQFDRDLIYRSPLASSSQQASARNTQVQNSPHNPNEPMPAKTPRARPNSGNKAASKRAATQQQQVPSPLAVSALPAHIDASRSTPSPPVPYRNILNPQQTLPMRAQPTPSARKLPKSTLITTPVPSEAFYEPNSSASAAINQSILLRLAALETNVSGLLQVLRPAQLHQQSKSQQRMREPPTPIPPTLMVSSNCSNVGPEKDGHHPSDSNGRVGFAPVGAGDPLSEGLLNSQQVQYLYDVFVDCCLPSLPILHRVQLSMIRARSPFLFSTMLTIGARFCSTQAVSQSTGTLSVPSSPNPLGPGDSSSKVIVDETTYSRLVGLTYQHLSSTLLKPSHSLDDVRAILFLACWALVSNEDPVGAPNRWVLVGHAGRIGRSIGLDRVVGDMMSNLASNGNGDSWNSPDQQDLKRDQLDAIKTDYTMRSIEAFLSTNLRIEPTRDFFSRTSSRSSNKTTENIVQLATGSPFQYDVISTTQVQAMAELAEIWASSTTFLSMADEFNRSKHGSSSYKKDDLLSDVELAELGETHNSALDDWAKKWTWHGSAWVPLLGNNLRTLKLLSESLRITLNLALTNVLYGSLNTSSPSHRFQERLSVALDRVNGSSTAVIQTHRDSVREGFSLAFTPDLITDGLVSAALTVLQLATPFNNPRKHDDARGPSTPTSSDGKGNAPVDVEMSDVTTTTSGSTKGRQLNHQTSPVSPPPVEESGTVIGKKALMEPAVAAHYIRMATDVLRASDRSQTRLATTMASKILLLGVRAGLLGAPQQQYVPQQQPHQPLPSLHLVKPKEQDGAETPQVESVEKGPTRESTVSLEKEPEREAEVEVEMQAEEHDEADIEEEEEEEEEEEIQPGEREVEHEEEEDEEEMDQ